MQFNEERHLRKYILFTLLSVTWKLNCCTISQLRNQKSPLVISSASVRSIPFLSFIEPVFAWNVPLVSLIFLKRSLVFPFLLFSSISLHWSLRKAFLSLLAILWNFAFKWEYLSYSPLLFASLLFTAICKASSDSHFAFFAFLFHGDGLDPSLLYNVKNLCP